MLVSHPPILLFDCFCLIVCDLEELRLFELAGLVLVHLLEDLRELHSEPSLANNESRAER